MNSICSEPTVHRTDSQLGLPIQVLLVEDDLDVATYTSAQVSQNPTDIFKVEWKDNVLSAISRLAEPGVDVILLDLGMPGWGGYKTHLAIISVVRTTVPVVILTGDESAATQDMTRLHGAANYLIKHRTSPVKLRQALYEAVVPPRNPRARFRWWISDT
jgi:CheY-like chemotaxis protein